MARAGDKHAVSDKMIVGGENGTTEPSSGLPGAEEAADASEYPGWKFNNIQPVTRPDGSIVDGMLLFYGWKDKDAPEARAFLLDEHTGLAPVETSSANQ